MARPGNPYIIEAVANVGGSAESYQGEFGDICQTETTGKQNCHTGWSWAAPEDLPIPADRESSGVFSLAWDVSKNWAIKVEVVVGGDYLKPESRVGTAAYRHDSGQTWMAAETMPHGYRSAVAWDAGANEWITVGPNGTDISTDDGKNWRALQPDVGRGEAADADRNWNALSLPFVVGPKGRIGKRAEGSGARKVVKQ
jgi:hypothetical protein